MAIRRNSGWTAPGNRSNGTITYWNKWYQHNTGRSSREGYFAIERIERGRQRPKTTIPITKFKVGQVVIFRKAVHYRMSGQDYARGVIRSWYYNGLIHYMVESIDTIQDVCEWQVHPDKSTPLLPAPKERGNKSLPKTPEIILLPAMAGERAA